MLNRKAKIRKTQNKKKTCFTKATIVDSDDSEPSQSVALVGSNDDLLTEILLRVPAISILRFKSVSKHWQSLLTDQCFTLLYNKVSVSVSPGLFVRDLYIPFDVGNQNAPPFHSLDFYHARPCIRIVQSCNGLLLCCSNRWKEHTRKYYVFNPTTMQFTVIPSIIGGEGASKTIRLMGLAFHQADCVHYKVVCFHKAKFCADMLQIQIYYSETGKWRISRESFFLYDSHCSYGAYWNGAIHWIPTFVDLFYFKLDVEQVKQLLLPERVAFGGGRRPLYFGESRGHLHFVECAPHESILHLNVYEMLSDHSGWFIKYKVEFDELAVAHPKMIRSDQHSFRPRYDYEFQVFDVVRGEDEEDTFMVVRIREKIIRYNILNKSFKQIFNLPNRCETIEHVDVHRYTQTLSSL